METPRPTASSDEMTGSKYHQLFIEVLTEHSQTTQPLTEWKYVGGDTGRHGTWFKTLYPNRAFLSPKVKCICTHPIVENCYIEHKITEKILIVGNCCIKRFLPEDAQGRSCPKCNQPHHNRNDPWCNTCRGGILTKGKHKGKSFRWILEREPGYGRFILGINGKGQLSQLANWLEQNGMTPTANDRHRRTCMFCKHRKGTTSYQRKSIVRNCPLRTLNFARDRAINQGLESINLSSLRRTDRQVIDFGKHKGRSYKWVLNHHRGYCDWARTVRSPNEKMKPFQDWLNSIQN